MIVPDFAEFQCCHFFRLFFVFPKSLGCCLCPDHNTNYHLIGFKKDLLCVPPGSWTRLNQNHTSLDVCIMDNHMRKAFVDIPEVNFWLGAFKFDVLRTLRGYLMPISNIYIYSNFVTHFLIILGAGSWLYGTWTITWNSFHRILKSRKLHKAAGVFLEQTVLDLSMLFFRGRHWDVC